MAIKLFSSKWISSGMLLVLLLSMAMLIFASINAPQQVWAASSDAVVDAKRKAAAQLLKDGKFADAISLYNEVVQADPAVFTDHLQLARAHDKLNHSAESIAAYKKVLDLIPITTTNADERAAKSEAERKAKVVAVRDTVSGKIETTADEYVKKLDLLEREAISTRNLAALTKIFRLKGSTWVAMGYKDRGYLEVVANLQWQKTNVEVRQGQVYRVRAAGTWTVYAANPAPSDLTANGLGKKNHTGYISGSLLGQVNGKQFQLGEDATFTAPANGVLELMEEELNHQDRIRNKGSIAVLISQ